MDRALHSIISSRFGIFYAVTDRSLSVKLPDTRLLQYLGIDADSMKDIPLADLFHEVIGIEHEILEVISRERDSISIKRINRSVNGEIYFNLHFFSDTGDPGYTYIVVEDITESSISFREAQQRRNEIVIRNLELVKREEFVTTLLDTIPEPVFYSDSSGRLIGCNIAFEKFSSKKKDEISGKTINEILLTGDRLTMQEEELFESCGTESYDTGITDGAGKEKHVIINKSIFSGRDIKSSVIVTLITDITERKKMEEQLKETMIELEKSEKILNEKIGIMENNLLIARKAVETLIQRDLPQYDWLDIEYCYLPVEQIGGDFYSVVPFDGFTGVFICDITGHGVASALFLSLLKYFTENVDFSKWLTPPEYLSMINREYFKGNQMFYFFSAIAGSIIPSSDSTTAEFRFSNGGHPHPIVIRQNGEVFFAGGNDAVIGLFEEQKFSEFSVTLERGDMLFLYTDGIPTTTGEGGAILGFDESLLEVFRRSKRGTLKETVKSFIDEVIHFRGSSRQEDDILLLGFYLK